MTYSTKPPRLDKIADPDDDLDDLDELLDEFSETPSAPPPTASTSSFSATSGRPRTNTRVDAKPTSIPGIGPPLDATSEVDESELSSEFAKELAKGMESLMREISGDSSAEAAKPNKGGVPGEDDETTKALKAAWEAMLIEGMNGKPGNELLPSLGDILADKPHGAGAAGSSSSPATAVPENFQNRIKQTMEKLKESESNLRGSTGGASGAAADGSPESLESLLKSLGDLGLGGEGGGDNDAELAGFLESMMSQLMSKEILYEPLKELAESFPGYLANPPQPLTAEDRSRYEKQLVCVKRIIEVFDKPSYSDTDPASNKAVVDLMSEMQSHGSPPSELMGPLPAGFEGGNVPGLDRNNPDCTIA